MNVEAVVASRTFVLENVMEKTVWRVNVFADGRVEIRDDANFQSRTSYEAIFDYALPDEIMTWLTSIFEPEWSAIAELLNRHGSEFERALVELRVVRDTFYPASMMDTDDLSRLRHILNARLIVFALEEGLELLQHVRGMVGRCERGIAKRGMEPCDR